MQEANETRRKSEMLTEKKTKAFAEVLCAS